MLSTETVLTPRSLTSFASSWKNAKCAPGMGQYSLDLQSAGGESWFYLFTLQEGSLLSFGRPTYGRLGRSKADVNSDEGLPEPTAVDGLEESTIVSAAAGVFPSRLLACGKVDNAAHCCCVAACGLQVWQGMWVPRSPRQ